MRPGLPLLAGDYPCRYAKGTGKQGYGDGGFGEVEGRGYIFPVGGHLGFVVVTEPGVEIGVALFLPRLVGLEVDDVGGCHLALGIVSEDEAVDGGRDPFVAAVNGFDGLLVVGLLTRAGGKERGDFRLLQGIGDDLLGGGLRRGKPVGQTFVQPGNLLETGVYLCAEIGRGGIAAGTLFRWLG